jgi:hypothetical protein
MARVREILLPWDSQPQHWTGVNGGGFGAGLRRVINGAITAPVEQAELSPITSLTGGSVDSPIVVGDYGLAVQLDNALYNGIVQTPGWTDRTGEATFCLIFDRDAAGDTSCWELGSGSGDEFPFSAKAYFDVAWSSRWGNAVNPPSGASFADRVTLHFCVKNGEQRAYWNGQLWHSNTASGGFAIPATLTWAKATLKGKFYGGFGWERFLSAGEVAAHYAAPWSPLAPQTIYIPVSAGGGPATHATSGALAAAGATLAGSAAHIAKHATSGALAGSGAAVAGSSARTRAHPTSGALAGGGATLAGAANHVVPGGTHDTSGTLTGAGAAVVGSAAHIAKHATSGALTGSGATLAGSAARVAAAVTHATSGALVGDGAVVVGAAVGGGEIDGGFSDEPKRRKYVAVKRDDKFLLFDDQEQADEFLVAETKAAQPVRKKFRKAAPAPRATYEIDPAIVKPLLSHYTPTLDVDAMLRAEQFEQILQAKAKALRDQDDEDAEILLMVA